MELERICEWKEIKNRYFNSIEYDLGFVSRNSPYSCNDCDGKNKECEDYWTNNQENRRRK